MDIHNYYGSTLKTYTVQIFGFQIVYLIQCKSFASSQILMRNYLCYLYTHLVLSLTINTDVLTTENIATSTIFPQTVITKKKDSRKRSNCDVSTNSCKSK